MSLRSAKGRPAAHRPWQALPRSARRPSFVLVLLAAASALAAERPGENLRPAAGRQTLPQCTAVHLSAAYLAETAPHQGPGFLITVSNDTAQEVKLARPVPSSAHWYAETPAGRWLWRASTGFGGALVNAMNERGPLFAYRPSNSAVLPVYLAVPAHGQMQWAEPAGTNAILSYRPGCERCRNPGDAQFRAVLAYAYVAPLGQSVPGLLACGLRSNLAVMPPPQ